MTSTTPIDGLAEWLRNGKLGICAAHPEQLAEWASAVESLALERIAVPEGQADPGYAQFQRDRIRADEREQAALKMAIAVDHLRHMAEGRGLIPGAAEGYKTALLVIEPMFREYLGSDAAPVAEPESMNSHLTDVDGSQVQAR